MIAHERDPALDRGFRWFWIAISDQPYAARSESDLRQQFHCDSCLSLGRIVHCDFDDQPSDIGRDPRPAVRRRLPLPEQSNPFRCHQVNVSGLTTVKTSRHSNHLESRAQRIESVAARGLAFRSTRGRVVSAEINSQRRPPQWDGDRGE